MVKRSIAVIGLAASALAAGEARGQSSGVNPDISVIPEILVCPQGASDCPLEGADGNVELQEVELALQGYLNPYVRGDLFFAYHDGDFEVEEAFATFVRGLGPFQARIGKFLVDWGSVNPLHPHAYPWIFRPLVEERFFGAEGLNQIGGNLNLSFPAGERGELTVSANVLRGDVADGHGHEGDESGSGEAGTICVGPGCDDGLCEPGDLDCALVYYDPARAEEPEASPELAYHLRVSWFNEIRPDHSLQVSANGMRATVEPRLDREVTWYGADVKYRWRPDRYRSLNLIGAWLANRIDRAAERVVGTTCVGPGCVAGTCPIGGVCREIVETEEVRGDTLTTSGWYAIADWQFAQRWNAGVKLDRAEGLESVDSIERAEAFVNWRLMEESTVFRLLFRREDGDFLRSANHTTAIQLVFSLGPHRPHTF